VDFVAVVDQAIALLRQRGHLTYRTLQLQFQLDEAHLEALKDELLSMPTQRSATMRAAVSSGRLLLQPSRRRRPRGATPCWWP